MATDVLTGSEVLLSDGDAISALLASCAIPGIFPPVTRAGRVLCDGALADNSAISAAVALGAECSYVLPSGTACALERPPSRPLAAALHALTLLLEQRAILETRSFAGTAALHVMPPLCPRDVPAVDFSRAAELINFRGAKARWYANATDIADFLAKANPRFWPRRMMRVDMRTHLDQTPAEAGHELTGDYPASVRDYEAIHHHILDMADMLSAGITQQFPRRFR